MFTRASVIPIPPPDDPIVAAGVSRFAREGFDAPLRAIAQDAGVSAALVIKRFGSKDGLRAACDAHVLDVIRRAKERNIAGATEGRLLGVLAESDVYAPIVAYAMKSVVAGGPLGREFVEQMIADAEGYLAVAEAQGIVRPSRDSAARARHLVMSAMGSFLLSLQLDPPADPGDLPAVSRRLQAESTLPMLELFTEGLFTTRRLLDDYLLYVSDPPGGQPHGSPAPHPTDPADSDPADKEQK
ncbi:TetR/AcrR family transcriptional regulator [Microbacterium album]|uniref:TetR family transcriptional regulator n=1 Tax=Microbacterium album TaxID=2053191 RepID=A0A917IG21_9MICO|nr:TetR family transcriptional regulator [Microbacterium album]GGH41877.1 TetR family transcriptional regulator [Microbacterium album]